eukprot:Skav203798  [mRNA]  locus=scaffold206:638006:638383:+ [translate_table: standard]
MLETAGSSGRGNRVAAPVTNPIAGEVKGELGSEWLTITIDEKIPCHAGTTQPRFAQANSREIWVLLMEKAFAKMYGGYDKLEGPLVRLKKGHALDCGVHQVQLSHVESHQSQVARGKLLSALPFG